MVMNTLDIDKGMTKECNTPTTNTNDTNTTNVTLDTQPLNHIFSTDSITSETINTNKLKNPQKVIPEQKLPSHSKTKSKNAINKQQTLSKANTFIRKSPKESNTSTTYNPPTTNTTKSPTLQHIQQKIQERILLKQSTNEIIENTSIQLNPPSSIQYLNTIHERERQETIDRIQRYQLQQIYLASQQSSNALQSNVNMSKEQLQFIQMEQETRRRVLQQQQLSTFQDLGRSYTTISNTEKLVNLFATIQGATNARTMNYTLDQLLLFLQSIENKDPVIVNFAYQDFSRLILSKRIFLMEVSQWPMELQGKCQYMLEVLRGMVETRNRLWKDTTPPEDITKRNQEYLQLKAIKNVLQEQFRTGIPHNNTQQMNPKHKLGQTAGIPMKAKDNNSGKKRDITSSSGKSNDVNAAKRGKFSAPNTPIHSVQMHTPKDDFEMYVHQAQGPISPRIVDKYFDLDLSSKSCTLSSAENEDRLYFPLKTISTIMKKVLPCSKETDSTSASNTPRKNSDIDADDIESIEISTEKSKIKGLKTKLSRIRGKNSEASTPVSSVGNSPKKRKSRRTYNWRDPPPIKINDDAVALMQECATEFLLYFTSEAKDQSDMELWKASTNSQSTATIVNNIDSNGTLEGLHVIGAMENLGFSTYAKVLHTYLDKVKAMQNANLIQKLEKKQKQKEEKAAMKEVSSCLNYMVEQVVQANSSLYIGTNVSPFLRR